MNINIKERAEQFINTLQAHNQEFCAVTPFDLRNEPVTIFDFTKNNTDLTSLDLSKTANMNKYIFDLMKSKNTKVGIGKYNENRAIYKRSELFKSSKDNRSIHLGIDLWVKADTQIFTPLDAKIHSFQDNNNFGDYGPTIILEHKLDNIIFYTLYGHLSRESLNHILIGQRFKAGEKIATVGNYPINGDWPPHLHFQIILDMEERHGDFPGVASPNNRNYYLMLCPDPSILLGIK